MDWFAYPLLGDFPRVTNSIGHFRTSRIGSFGLPDRGHIHLYLNHDNAWFNGVTNAEISISARSIILTNR